MNIFSQKSEAFGLDISDLSLKIAKLESSGKELRLASFAESAIPPGIIEAGEIRDEKTLAETIKNCLKEIRGEKIKTKYVNASLPEEKSFLDIIRIPSAKEEEIENAVRFEAENHIPVPLEEVYFGFEKIQPTLPRKNQQELLIAATPKKIVNSYLKTLKYAGLKPKVFEIECLAIVRALIKKRALSRPLLIIDFGETRTTFIIFSGQSLRFTSTISISSRNLTESIAKNLKVDLREAEKLKKKEGLEGKKEISKAMLPILTDLAQQIKSHLEYYHSHAPKNQISTSGKKVEKILLCGGAANLKGLVDFLSSALRVEVALGNPWVNILRKPLKEVPGLSFEKSLAYATALGLALREIYD